jgi:hypothetical protein
MPALALEESRCEEEELTWGFEEGRIYNRRSDIHARFGGEQARGDYHSR